MPTPTKFNQFVKDLIDGVHDFDAHTFKVMLCNTAPVVGNAIKSALTEITAGNGYSAGGSTTAVTTSLATATARVIPADVTITAAGGPIGPFRYAVLYNDTPTSPADPLICFIDYGSSITLLDGENVVIDFDGTNGVLSFV